MFREKLLAIASPASWGTGFGASLVVLPAGLSLSLLGPTVPSVIGLGGAALFSVLCGVLFARAAAPCGTVPKALSGLALIGASLLACGFAHRVWHGRVEALRAELRKGGHPASIGEALAKIPKDARYADPALAAIVDDSVLGRQKGTLHPGLSAFKWSKEIAGAEAAYVREAEPLLDGKLAPALRLGFTAYMERDPIEVARRPVSYPLPKFARVMALADASRLCAAKRAFDGDAARGWEHVRRLVELAAVAELDPSMIGKLVGVAVRRQAAKAVLAVRLNRPGAALPADLEGRLRDSLERRLADEALRLEAAWQLDMARFFDEGGYGKAGLTEDQPSRGDALAMRAFAGMGLVDANALAGVSAILKGADERWTPARDHEVDRGLERLPAWPYFIARIATPSFQKLHQKEADQRAWTAAALKIPSPDGYDLCSSDPAGPDKDALAAGLCGKEGGVDPSNGAKPSNEAKP